MQASKLTFGSLCRLVDSICSLVDSGHDRFNDRGWDWSSNDYQRIHSPIKKAIPMKIQVFKVEFRVMEMDHFFYDIKLKEEAVYEAEIHKIGKTGRITSICQDIVSEEEYLEHNFRHLKKWNKESLQQRFSHLDKEAIE